MPSSEPPPSNDDPSDGPPDETASSGWDIAQVMAVLVIVTALSLTVAGSLEWVVFSDSTLRLLLGGGILLSAGAETIRAVADRFAS